MDKLIESRRKFGSGQRPQLWVTASGKGGVGKTFISTSMAISLTKLGYSVTIVDLDFSGANVHTALGQPPAPVSIRHWFESQKDLQETVTPSSIPRLGFIQGLWDTWSSSEITMEQVQKLIPQLRSLRSDCVIVDLGPGPTPAHLALFAEADERILVSSPEPTSIEKTYRFLEGYICNALQASSRPEAFSTLVKELREHRNRKHRKPFSFRHYLKTHEGFEIDHFEALSKNPLRLMINSSRSQANSDLGYAMKSVCAKSYDLSLDFLAAIEFDNAVWQSIRNREPVLIAQPFTPLAGQFLTVCKHLIAPHEMRAVG